MDADSGDILSYLNSGLPAEVAPAMAAGSGTGLAELLAQPTSTAGVAGLPSVAPAKTTSSGYSQTQEKGMVPIYSQPVYETRGHGNQVLVDQGGKFLGYQKPEATPAGGKIETPKPPEIIAKEKELGHELEPIYAMGAVQHGSGTSQPVEYGEPIGYRYDNGQSQYVNFDTSGQQTSIRERSNLGTLIRDLAPLALTAVGANFLAPYLAGGAAAGAGAGAGAAFTPEMIAAGLTPGSIGAAGAASGALTGAELAAATGAGSLGAGAATLGGLTAEELAASDLAAYEPTTLSEILAPVTETAAPAAETLSTTGGYGSGMTNPSLLSSTGAGEIAALPASEVASLGSNVAPSLNQLAASGMGPGSYGALNYPALEAAVTAGTITPEALSAALAAASGVVTAGATPALVELANAGKGLPSVNEMIASGGGPGSVGAAGAAAGELTPAELAAVNGVSTAGSATAGLTSSVLDKLKDATGLSADKLKGLISGAGGLLAAYQANQPQKIVGYQGGIPSYTAVQGRAAEPVAGSRPGAGHQYFTGVQFAPASGLPAAQSNIDAQVADLNKLNAANALARNPVNKAEGGIMGLAHGGMPTHPHGTYLRGDTDGMADKIPGTIDGVQPARLAHGEFVIPADVVSHLGNGNSDAGAQQLYKMMDRIRMARTGSPKQGKEINPDKFMPGGLAHAHYAMGGNVYRFDGTTGSTVPSAAPATSLAGTESNLSNWAGPYVTEMLGKTQALTNAALEKPQFYQGELTAGPSDLQKQAYGNAANLSTPTSIGTAANTAGDISKNLTGMSYSPTTFGNEFKAPDAYQASNITNQFKAPQEYKAAGSSFDAAQAQQYMNPYIQASLNPQLEEARRQSQITQMQNAAKMSSAGGFGGSRQAIMDAENQRNLGTNLANITGQGYNTAFGQAQNQFNADQARKIQEAQYGAQQGMTAAQLQAQYGLSAQQANEASRQFGAQQGMTAAQLAAQYGLSGKQAGEQSKQFGAQYGLNAQNAALAAAQAQGQLGALQNQTGLANLGMIANLGATQQETEQRGLTAAKAQFDEQKADPYKQLQFQKEMLQGLPVQAQSYNTTINPIAAAAAGASGAGTVFDTIFGPNAIPTPVKP